MKTELMLDAECWEAHLKNLKKANGGKLPKNWDGYFWLKFYDYVTEQARMDRFMAKYPDIAKIDVYGERMERMMKWK